MNATSPLGIFDSGIGGLTVVRAVIDLLPNEKIIYFGDTAHLPYGDKSKENIIHYSKNIVDFLLEKNCKLILIACNSASAAAYDELKNYIGDRAILMNVIDPVIQYIRQHFTRNIIGLIGTQQTIGSKIYEKKIESLGLDIELRSLATSLLASAIEDQYNQKPIIQNLLENYLNEQILQNIEALILGCTHYPLIKKEIIEYYKNNIEIIDAPIITAKALKETLEKNNLLNKTNDANHEFYVSSLTDSFKEHAKLFFHETIYLKEKHLGN